MNDINAYKISFRIKSPYFDDKPNEWKETAEPITLGEIIEWGLSTQLNFTDGSTMQFGDVDWETDTVQVSEMKASYEKD